VPRFRFQWTNLPSELQIALLPEEQKTISDSGAALKALYGARPKEDFVRNNWETLLGCWLSNDKESAEELGLSLRSVGLGDLSAQTPIDYLKSCKNTKNLRAFVLQSFLDYGEQTPIKSENAEAIRQITRTAVTPDNSQKSSSPKGSEDDDTLKELMVKALLAVSNLFSMPVENVIIDDDGDIVIPYGSTSVFIRPIVANPLRFSLFSPLLSNVEETTAMYELINEVNKALIVGSITFAGGYLTLEYSLLSSISGDDLAIVLDYMTDMADQYDNKLQEYVGGKLFLREKNNDEVEV
jgi:hypothetical protein